MGKMAFVTSTQVSSPSQMSVAILAKHTIKIFSQGIKTDDLQCDSSCVQNTKETFVIDTSEESSFQICLKMAQKKKKRS